MWTLLPSSSLRVTGADRVDFIHGQMTNDLRSQAVPGMVPCLFLNVRGQIESFARAYRRQDDVYLHLAAGEAAGLEARLRRYIIFDQVQVQDTTDTLDTVHIWNETDLPGWSPDGPAAQEWTLNGVNVLGGRVNRSGKPGVDLHFLTRQTESVLAALTAPEAPLGALEAVRIQAGLPDVAADHFQGNLPQEVGLDLGGPLPAISYRKGCYVGQEIMARLEARGQARYQLVQLHGEDLPAHAEIVHNGKTVGQTGAVAGGLALARLRREFPEGEQVTVQGVPAQVRWLEASTP